MEPSPKFKRRWMRFSQPRDQLLLMLPTLTMLLFVMILSHSFLTHIRNASGLILADNQIGSEIIDAFVFRTNRLAYLFWIGCVGLSLVGFFWAWRVSFWIFGPFTRLERELKEILDGHREVSTLRVRDEDALFPLIELVRHILLRLTKKSG